MPFVPIIIPPPQTRVVECIVVEGKHYCESGPPMTNAQAGALVLGSVVILVWLIISTGLIVNWDDRYWMLYAGLAMLFGPPILLGIGLCLA